MEVLREENVATHVIVPMIDSDNRPDRKSGIVFQAGEVKVLLHTGAAWTVSNITALPTEIGSTGVYDIALTAAEVNPDDNQYPVSVIFVPGSGDTWDEQCVIVWTRPATTNVKQISDDTTAANNPERHCR